MDWNGCERPIKYQQDDDDDELEEQQ